MRRILWTLTACGAIGATVSWSLAQEQGGAAPPSGEARRSFLSFGAQTGAAGNQGRPNYSSLFEEAPAASRDASQMFRRDLTEDARGEIIQIRGENLSADPVVHAEFERLPGQRDAIEQVAAGPGGFGPQSSVDSFGRPLPGMAEVPGPQAAPAPEVSNASLLSQPVAVESFGPAARPYVRQQTDDRPRNVTFVRSASRPDVVTPVRPDSRDVVQVSAVQTAAETVKAGPVAIGAVAAREQRQAQTPEVTLEWVTHSGINVGQECECDLVVRNSGLIPARQIEVVARFPASARIVSTDPAPVTGQVDLAWRFDQLEPGQEQTIHVRLIPTERGNLDTVADVRFSGSAATSLRVAEPLIEVATEGPQEVLVGEPASQTVIVRNPGDGIATNVQIEAVIPKGLEHARGDRLLMDVGSLNPGESRSVRLALAAVNGGKHVVQIQARADGDLLRETTSEIRVIAPSLSTEMDGPSLRYLGRNATYTLRVRNDGAITTENVRVMIKVADGFDVIESDRGAQYDRPNRLLNWFVGRLNTGESAEVKVTMRADKIGQFTHFVRSTSEHGAIADTQFTTTVEGTPSLSMDIVDLDDPVEVGHETAYQIVVKNEGSAPARKVSLLCEIPPELTVLKAHGPVGAIQQVDSVAFDPVIELAPGNSVTYRVHVKGTRSGHHRFRARLTSDSTPESLTGDELTRVYGE